jgi:hypothetical protein
MRNAIERAILLRLREQQRHPGQCEEERDWKAAYDVIERHAADVHADNPRQCDGEDADVQLRETTDENGDNERAKGDVSEIHSPGISS